MQSIRGPKWVVVGGGRGLTVGPNCEDGFSFIEEEDEVIAEVAFKGLSGERRLLLKALVMIQIVVLLHSTLRCIHLYVCGFLVLLNGRLPVRLLGLRHLHLLKHIHYQNI